MSLSRRMPSSGVSESASGWRLLVSLNLLTRESSDASRKISSAV